MLTLGQGDVGQLGLGESVLERKKPALVPLLEDVVQAEAGGMHTVCLSQSGQVGQRVGGWVGYGPGARVWVRLCANGTPWAQVYSFGCNDEGALGRDTSAEGSEMVPGKVELQEKVVQVSAGDSHTAALTEDGRVFLWGSFRVRLGLQNYVRAVRQN